MTSQSSKTLYWNQQCELDSSRIWLPTLDDFAMHSNVLTTLGQDKVQKSWFSIKQVRSLVDIESYHPSSFMESGHTNASKKIRIYPTPEQKEMFKHWFGVSRKVYNTAVDLIKQQVKYKNWMAAAKDILDGLPDYADSVPYQIKKIAVNDAYKAFTNGCRKAKRTGKPFDLKFRSKKQPQQSCYIPKSAVLSSGIYPRISGKMKYSEELPNEILDSRLLFDNGRWFIVVPTKTITYSTDNQGRVIALDPGVRTFMTGFSPVEVVKFGDGDFGRIARLCSHLDKLKSKMTKVCSKTRYKMKKAARRIQWKIKDLVSELHWKVGTYLVQNYDVILLPTFETSQMTSKTKRKLHSKTVRSMLTLSHYSFKVRLKHLANKFGKTVIDVNEAYTSKTASWTGEVKYNLGGAKSITSGGLTVDRDVNGARGILLRALVDSPSLRTSVCIG